jgi:hypothetical protein
MRPKLTNRPRQGKRDSRFRPSGAFVSLPALILSAVASAIARLQAKGAVVERTHARRAATHAITAMVSAIVLVSGASARADETSPWAHEQDWISVRAGYAKTSVKNAADGLVGVGFGFNHFRNSKWAFGAYAHYEVLGRFGAAAEIEVPLTASVRRPGWGRLLPQDLSHRRRCQRHASRLLPGQRCQRADQRAQPDRIRPARDRRDQCQQRQPRVPEHLGQRDSLERQAQLHAPRVESHPRGATTPHDPRRAVDRATATRIPPTSAPGVVPRPRAISLSCRGSRVPRATARLLQSNRDANASFASIARVPASGGGAGRGRSDASGWW